MAGHVQTTVWLNPDPDRDVCSVRLLGGGQEAFAVIELVRGADLYVHDPSMLTALASAAVEARDLLTAALAGQDRLPVDTGKAV